MPDYPYVHVGSSTSRMNDEEQGHSWRADAEGLDRVAEQSTDVNGNIDKERGLAATDDGEALGPSLANEYNQDCQDTNAKDTAVPPHFNTAEQEDTDKSLPSEHSLQTRSRNDAEELVAGDQNSSLQDVQGMTVHLDETSRSYADAILDNGGESQSSTQTALPEQQDANHSAAASERGQTSLRRQPEGAERDEAQRKDQETAVPQSTATTSAWKDSSAFDALDESWIEPQGATLVSADASIQSKKDHHTLGQRPHVVRKPSSDAATDSALLRPGPSSPTYRMPSHQMPLANEDGSESVLSDVEVDGQGQEHIRPSEPLSPSRSGRSLSSSSSGEKQGARLAALHVNPPPEVEKASDKSSKRLDREDGNGHSRFAIGATTYDANEETNADHYGSAREHFSNGSVLLGAVTAEEQTFIEHSEVTPVPEFLKPDWAKKGKRGRARDMFTPLKLETMFDPPSFVKRRQNGGQNVDGQDEALLKERQDELSQEHEAAMDLTHSEDAEIGLSRDAEIADKSQRSHDDSEPPRSCSEGEDGEHRSRQDAEPSRDAQRSTLPVPQCRFTFASPSAPIKPTAPPPTPSAAHAPLRLFQLCDKNAEIEQILNTPRSPEKAADAKRIVWELVGRNGEGHTQRDTKRLRLDRLPSPQSPEMIGEEEEAAEMFEGEAVADAPRESTPLEAASKAETRERPKFMDRLQNLRAVIDSQQKLSSASAARRRPLDGPLSRAIDLERDARVDVDRRESPRKLLRRWSAANEVDEELQQEGEGEVNDVVANAGVLVETNAQIASSDSRRPQLSRESSFADLIERANSNDRLDTDLQSSGTSRKGDGHSPEAPSHKAPYSEATDQWVQRHREGERHSSHNSQSDPFKYPNSRGDWKDKQSNAQGVAAAGLGSPTRAPSNLRNEIQITVSDLTGGESVPSEQEMGSQHPYSPHAPMMATPARASSEMPLPTPRSILKTGGARSKLSNGLPSSVAEPGGRSISFADGYDPRLGSRSERAEKIEDLLKQLAVLAIGPDDKSIDTSFTDQVTPTRPTVAKNFKRARSPWNLSMLRGPSERGNLGEGSFLTNASFDVAHDRLLELITDVAPFEEDWRDLRTIDLRNRRVESLNRLREFLPRLEHALLDDNEISYLSGLPLSIRTLSIARNRLPCSAAFGAFTSLETLDVSHNSIDLKALDKLVLLRHLRADENKLVSVDGIQHLRNLETLHLRGNRIGNLTISRGQWPQLETLVLSHNRLIELTGIGNLHRLRSLNLDHNSLEEIDLGDRMPNLRQLRISGNSRLSYLDVGPARKIKTLYADECALQDIVNIGLLQKLDNLSLRQQHGERGLHWPAKEVRDIKRLFLSGNAFRAIDLHTNTPLQRGLRAVDHTNFYAMVYLELSACQLTSLPPELSDMVPNLRHLNADYNLLDTLPIMADLKRLKRLSLVGCRIDPSRILVESLQGCEELLSLDVRMNPCTLGLYPPILMVAPLLSASDQHRAGVGRTSSSAFLPPIPHPSLARPDKEFLEDTTPKQKIGDSASAGQAAEAVGEKSYFHKRKPPPHLPGDAPGQISEDGEGQESVWIEPTIHGTRLHRAPAAKNRHSAFVTSDDRFKRTLPANFRLQRLLHRGTLAMACPSLTWLDGLLIDEEEVQQADEYYRLKLGTSLMDRDIDVHDQAASDSSHESMLSSNASDRNRRYSRR